MASVEAPEGDAKVTSSVVEKSVPSTGSPVVTKAQLKRERAAAKKEKQKAKKEAKGQRDQEWAGDIDRQNESFEQYYKNQGLLPEESDWDAFLTAMKSDLPTTFRVTGSRVTASDVNDIIRKVHVPNIIGIEYEGSPVNPPTQIPWYPEGLAWQLNVHKNVVRKVPEFKKLQSFLVYETEVGNISRQEAVSMLPPLVLDVEPHHRVLDMCAAPGSKTAQILEAVHASTASPSGIVIANDSDYKRAGLLVHQSSRLPSPALLVTNVDASYYPNIRVNREGDILTFDRILCDVPCSGDGTLRKNPVIWRQWGVASGNGLHSLQLRILQRAMKMLAPSGRIVYSTCSLNPIENEAVVAAALKASNGEYHLVDLSNRLPELVRRSGVNSWRVCVDKEAKVLRSSFNDYWNALSDAQKRSTKIVETMFPPSDAGDLHLERCWRIYPHLQNTGGFFVAVLERSPTYVPPPPKKKPPKRTAIEAEGTPEPSSSVIEERKYKRPRLEKEEDVDMEMTGADADANADDSSKVTQGVKTVVVDEEKTHTGTYKEHPYTYVDPTHPGVARCLESIQVRYHEANPSPDPSLTFPSSNLLVRNGDPAVLRSLYLTNSLVKSVLTSNEASRLRIISAGIKIATRQEGAQRAANKAKRAKGEEVTQDELEVDAKYRVLNDAISQVLPYMDPKEIMDVDMRVLKIFIRKTYPLVKEFGQPFRDMFEGCEFGHNVIRINTAGEDTRVTALSHPLIFAIWKSNISMSLMLDKRAKSALSLRLFGEDLTVEGTVTSGRDAASKRKDEVQANGEEVD